MASARHSESPEVIITVLSPKSPSSHRPPLAAPAYHRATTGSCRRGSGTWKRSLSEHGSERSRPAASPLQAGSVKRGGVTWTSETLVCKCGSSSPAAPRRALPTWTPGYLLHEADPCLALHRPPPRPVESSEGRGHREERGRAHKET